MSQYEPDPEPEPAGRQYPVPATHRLGLDSCLQPYLCGPAPYLLLLSRVRAMVQQLYVPPQRPILPQGTPQGPPQGPQGPQGDQKMQQLIDLVLSCKRNAEKEVQSEMKSGARKRKLEQEAAQRTIKHLKASQELRHLNAPHTQDGTEVASSSPGSLHSLIGSVGLRDTDLREEGSELASKLLSLLTSLNQKATNQSASDPREARPKESSPFDRLALRLGLPTNCDVDLRKQDDFEGGSVSSQEGFSPVSSHNADPRTAHRDREWDRGLDQDPRRTSRAPPAVCEEEEPEPELELELEPEPLQPDIPWVLIPITGLPSKHYTRRDADLPRDPRVHHLISTTATYALPGISTTTPSLPVISTATPSLPVISTTTPSPPIISTTTPSPSLPVEMLPMATASSSRSPAPSVPSASSSSPDPSPPASPSQCPSPDPSLPPSQCPSPEPEPPATAAPSSSEANPRSSPGPGLEPGSTPEHKAALSDPQESEETPVSGDAAEPAPETAHAPSTVTSLSQPSPRPHTPQKTTDELQDILILNPTSPTRPSQEIDSVVDRHLDSFVFDVQRILQHKRVAYTFPQSPHSTSQPERTAGTLSHAPVLQFSQYVSFYHPCPPVQSYVNSLQIQMSSVLSDYENNRTPNRPNTTTATTTTDATSSPDLASRISAFVASIRAANDEGDALPETRSWPEEDSEREVATSSVDCDDDFVEKTMQSDVGGSDVETDLDISNNGRRQVQFGGSRIEICIRNEPAGNSGSSSRDVEEAVGFTPESPPGNSDQNALNSLINQLQPEVFTTLVEIIKDIKRNTQHFYIHCIEEDDHTIQQIRTQLSQQAYIEQSPVLFLNQEESSNTKMLVVIKNQDIAAHIHQIPELLALKRCPSVQFLGVDQAYDLRNHSRCELFVSGGQVVSDEMVLNPDFVSHEKLSALLCILEKHNSPENVWRLKIHCKMHKKLKEQSRFRRDAASLLEVFVTFQKRQIVEILPYHKCDMSQGPELLDCAVELQGTNTSFRHTLLLTENRLVNGSGGGVVVCGIDEFLQDFRKLVGYHGDDHHHHGNDHEVQEPIGDEPQCTEEPSQSDPVPSDDLVSGSGPGSIPLHSEQDFEVLHRAISQLRAERQQQLRENQSDTGGGEGQGAPPTAREATADPNATSVTSTELRPPTTATDSQEAHLTPGRKAVAATLDLIHSTLHLTDEDRTKGQTRVPAQTQTRDPKERRASPETQVQTTVKQTTDQNRSPETQVAVSRSPEEKNPDRVETQLTMDREKSPEPQVSAGDGGSQGSAAASEPQRGATLCGESEPATGTVRPPAPSTSLTQSDVEQKEKTTTTPNSRTKRQRKRKGNVQQDDSTAKKTNIGNPNNSRFIQLATVNKRILTHWRMNNPTVWDSIAFVRDGHIPFETPIEPFNEDKLKQLTSQSTLRRVLEPVCRPQGTQWWPTRLKVYDSRTGPWALVEKVHKRSVSPVAFLFGQYSLNPPINQQRFVPQRSYQPFYEDGGDGVMYF